MIEGCPTPTARLKLRRFVPDDAGFMLSLLNDPDWIRYVGDRGVRTVQAAEDYLRTKPIAHYQEFGYGPWAVVVRESGELAGLCGYVDREDLPHPDLGFAFLPAYRRRGYAMEASIACLEFGRDMLGLTEVLAITDPDNEASNRLLARLNFERRGDLELPDEEISLWLHGVHLS